MAAVAWSRYSALLKSHPVSTKSVTSAVIAAVADAGLGFYEQSKKENKTCMTNGSRGALAIASTQPTAMSVGTVASQSKPSWDWSRTGVVTSMGLVYSGPLNHYWNVVLERAVTIRLRPLAVLTKCVLEQAAFAPLAIGGYISVRGAFEGKSPTQIAEKLQLRWADAWLSALQFWPAANAVSFAFVPFMYRALYGNLCAVFWNARLSALSADKTSSGEFSAAAIEGQAGHEGHQDVVELDVIRQSRSKKFKLSPDICLSEDAIRNVLQKRTFRGSSGSDSMSLSTCPVQSSGDGSDCTAASVTVASKCAVSAGIRNVCAVQDEPVITDFYYDDGIDIPDDNWDGWLEPTCSCTETLGESPRMTRVCSSAPEDA